MKRLATVLMIAALTMLISTSVFAAAFPVKPIQLIVPFTPGGGSDITARIVAEYMKPYLSQQVIVTNMDGAQGRTAEIHTQKSAADGYTLVWQHQTMHMAYATGRSDYTWEAFTPVCNGVKAYSAVVVSAKSPYKTMADLIKYMKANPKKIKWGVAPNGTSHFAYLSIVEETGVEAQLIPMSGDKNRIVSMLGGLMDASAITVGSAAPYLASGDLRVLGVMSEERSDLYPNIPTLLEQGIKAFNRFDYTVFAPKGLPEDVRLALEKAFKQALADPKCIAALAEQWSLPAFMDYKTTIELLKSDFNLFYGLAKKYNLTEAE